MVLFLCYDSHDIYLTSDLIIVLLVFDYQKKKKHVIEFKGLRVASKNRSLTIRLRPNIQVHQKNITLLFLKLS